jgi:uncharacterized protein YkwD
MSNTRRFASTVSLAVMGMLAALLCVGCMSATRTVVEEVEQSSNSRQQQADLKSDLDENIAYVKENASYLADMIHRMINEERKSNQLATLEWDRELASIALSHSVDMAERGYFDHYSPEGEDFASRYEKASYDRKTTIGNQVYVGGENLFLNNVVDSYTYDSESGDVHEYHFNTLEALARTTVDGWMESPGHRENILTPFSREGIGIAVSSDGKVYITENFS